MLAFVIVGALAAVGIGCSVEKNYKLLSFFFDGVPDPQSADAAARDRNVPGSASAGMVSAHPAYAEHRCAECHGASSRFGFFSSGFQGLDAGVCVRCHADVLDSTPRLHGPVAAMACLWCHDPHESPYPSLLADASPGICLTCHRLQLQGAAPTPGHEQPPVDCLTCHRGHGGTGRYLLHPPQDAAPPVPPADATQPGPVEP